MNWELLLWLALIVVLLLLSALFSGSETALTTASRAQMHHLAKRGNRRARVVNDLIERRERLIGTILLGNNLVNILASALATSLLIAVFGDAGVAYATVIMTALVLIFAEVMPKTYALHNANRSALVVAPLIRPAVALFGPLVRVVQAMVGAILRLFGVQITGDAPLLSPGEELLGAVDLHISEGRMAKTDRDMLGGILDLADVQVDEIMVHRTAITMIDAARPVGEIVEQVLKSPFTRFPLWRYEPENIIAILHAKDLLAALHRHGEGLSPDDITALARPPWFVPETTSLIEQLNAFRERRAHFALVVDEYGVLQGLVTLEDILEEIVGDIVDEHDDVATRAIRRDPAGGYVVEGTVTVRDLNRFAEWTLPDEEAATVAGLVIHEARRLPEVGESFEVAGFVFDVVARERNQVTRVRVWPRPSS